VAIDTSSIAQGDPVAAVDIPAGTVGQNPFTGSVGLDFNVNQPITITQLGVFDSGQTGLKQTLTAYLYDRTTKQLLAKVVFNPGEGTLIGGSRFKPLDQPLTLPAGFQGTIVADGFGPNQLFSSYQPGLPNAGVQPSWSVNNIGGRLSFVGARSGFTAGQFPDGVDVGIPVPYAYAAGTFLVDHPAWFQTGVPAKGTYTVTISSKSDDLKDLNDFSVAPAVPITGKISGHYLDPNGKLQGDTTPLVGWVVQLLDANKQVVATTTTDAAGRYLFNKIKPGQYTEQQVLPAGWRQADPFNGNLQFRPNVRHDGLSFEVAQGMVVGDFNNDGHPDFAIAAPTGPNTLFFFIYDPSTDS
jgi:SdrD B-like domain/FG-GAP repeat